MAEMKSTGIFWGLLAAGAIAVAFLSSGAVPVQAVSGSALEARLITPTVTLSPIATPTYTVEEMGPEALAYDAVTVTMSVTIYVPLTTKALTTTISPTPVASPTPLPDGIHVLTNHSAYEDHVDYLHIVGEVFNNTDANLPYVRISAHVLDTELHLVADAFAYTYLEPLPAGETTCFHISLEAPSDWALYTLKVERPEYSTVADRLPNLVLIEHSGTYDPDFGWYEITGRVRNEDWRTVDYVAPVSTLYNIAGEVVGCKFSYVDTLSLSPGTSSAFDIIYVGRDYLDVESYRIQVDGVTVDRRAR
jgi:hypothetical protein